MIDTIYTDPYFLAHHGIKDQKWGVRNGPNYPLGRDKGSHRSKAEISKNHASRSFTARRDSTIKRTGGSTTHRNVSESNIHRIKRNNPTSSSSRSNSRQHSELSDDAKRRIKIGVTVSAAALATAGTVYMIKSGKGAALINAGRRALGLTDDVAVSAFKGSNKNVLFKEAQTIGKAGKGKWRLIQGAHTAEQDLHAVNPGMVSWWRTDGVKNRKLLFRSNVNCATCTTAYDLRRRGFDIRAGQINGMNWAQIKSLYLNPSTAKVGAYKGYFTPLSAEEKLVEIEKAISQMGGSAHGARGNICVYWNGGGGHSMIWENVNGKIVFKDAQINKTYTNFTKEILSNTAGEIHLMRTDNAALNKEIMDQFISHETVAETYLNRIPEVAVNVARTTEGKVGATAAGVSGLGLLDAKSKK